MNHLKDLTGQRFTRLTVISRAENAMGQGTNWLCRCDCGNLKVVSRKHLVGGNTMSCGCLKKESLEKFYHRFDGVPRSTKKDERLYRIWKGMRNRCNGENHPKRHRYGGRGIKVCVEWDDYEMFKDWALTHGYKDNLTIDRIDNDGDYSPENCRWATNKQQSNNKSQNHIVRIGSESHTISEWSDISGVPSRTIWQRIKYGIEGERLITKGDLRSGRKCKRKVG